MRLSAFRLPAVLAPLFSALLLALAPLPAGAQSTSLGLLDGTVPVTGDDGAWSFSSANGAVTFSNSSDSGALRYYFADVPDNLDRTISADVYIDPASGPDGFGALLFAYHADEPRYALVALHGDGRIALYLRDSSGFSPVMSSTFDTPLQGWVHLELRESGDKVSWSANGEEVGSMERGGLGEGSVGLAAGGLVSASFANFVVSGY